MISDWLARRRCASAATQTRSSVGSVSHIVFMKTLIRVLQVGNTAARRLAGLVEVRASGREDLDGRRPNPVDQSRN